MFALLTYHLLCRALEGYGSYREATVNFLCCVIHKDNIILWWQMKITSIIDISQIFCCLKLFVYSAHGTVCGTVLGITSLFSSYSSADIDVKIKIWNWRRDLMSTCDQKLKYMWLNLTLNVSLNIYWGNGPERQMFSIVSQYVHVEHSNGETGD